MAPKRVSILVVEAIGLDINWMEPLDLSFTDIEFGSVDSRSRILASKHGIGCNCALNDGTVRSLHDASPLELRSMFLIR